MTEEKRNSDWVEEMLTIFNELLHAPLDTADRKDESVSALWNRLEAVGGKIGEDELVALLVELVAAESDGLRLDAICKDKKLMDEIDARIRKEIAQARGQCRAANAEMVVRTIKTEELGNVDIYFDPRSILFGWKSPLGFSGGGFDSYNEAVAHMMEIADKKKTMMDIPEKRVMKAKRRKNAAKPE